MLTKFIGKDGEYRIHNYGLIVQRKFMKEGEVNRKNIVHLTAESIENMEDREGVKLHLDDIMYDEIINSVLG